MKTNLVNGALLVTTLLLSMWAATLPGGARTVVPTKSGAADAPEAGATEVVDARGVAVPVAPYQRIVSLSTISDHALLGLVEPERLVAVTEYTSRHPVAWRFGARPTVSSSGALESVLSLRPDLVIVTLYADEAYLARLRENGIQVFDLGDMRGVETTRASIRALGALLDVRDRAAAFVRSYDRELAALDAVVADSDLVPGIYLSVYGDTFFGATANTSYADTLRLGGGPRPRRRARVRRLAPVHRRAAPRARPTTHRHPRGNGRRDPQPRPAVHAPSLRPRGPHRRDRRRVQRRRRAGDRRGRVPDPHPGSPRASPLPPRWTPRPRRDRPPGLLPRRLPPRGPADRINFTRPLSCASASRSQPTSRLS